MFSLIQTSLTSILILVSTITILLVRKIHGRRTTASRKESIAIVVLGDIARSPRMVRHALSFADQQWYVSIFAYTGWPSFIRFLEQFLLYPQTYRSWTRGIEN
jgi:hypothetical protein